MLRRGDFVEIDGLLAVVVGLSGEIMETDEGRAEIPEDHVALWYGEPRTERKSRGGDGGSRPIVLTVPSDYCEAALRPDVRH